MNKVFILLFISAFTLHSCCSDCKKPTQEKAKVVTIETKSTEPIFDSVKAYEYGADEYGMKKYIMAFLKRGPNRDLDSLQSYHLQKAHMDNISRLAIEGKLVLAGPFGGDGDLRGIYIFNVETEEEAKALTETDPAIQSGSLIMELLPWYGTAAVVGISHEHKTIAKKDY